MDYLLHPNRRLRHWLSGPIIWSMLLPTLISDICLEVYHRTCFPLYGIAFVPRRKYIRIDRHKLSYLQWFQKINCVYCGYVNGWLAYATEIVARTEQYWCAIEHQKDFGFISPAHHKRLHFLAYGDQKTFKEKYIHHKQGKD